MALHTLPKLVRRKKRVGRGIGSRGAKSGRGQKGQKSRAGYSRKAGFEGGQTPLYMRLPKARGSKQKFPSQVVKAETVNLADLRKFTSGTIVGPGQLHKAKLIRSRGGQVKIIGNVAIDRKLTVRTNFVSPQARTNIEAAGGKVEIIK
ncbi:MAG: 50S ribosomal protein L15 [Candidatus Andersenbacteria bacterium]